METPLASRSIDPGPGLRRSWYTLAETLDIDRADAIAILGLTSVALIVGAITIALTIDVPGDGPARANLAYIWSKHPRPQAPGNWLPGFSYLAGLCLMVMPNPLLAPRLYNLSLSALTIAAFYALVRKLYGSPAALLSTVALVALPLRIGLGASSLTEGSFLFFLIAALLCLTVAVEGAGVRMIALCMSLFFFDLAEITRYEVWPLIPLILCYLYARRRRISATAFAAAALLLFPVTWSVGNYLYFGNFFYPFSRISHPLEDAGPVGIATAIAYLWHRAGRHLGWLLSIGALAGLTSELYRTMRGRLGRQRAAYAILVGAVWVMIFEGTLARGYGMYDRFLFYGFALALPLAAVAYLEVCGRYRHSIAVGTLAIAASLSAPYYRIYPLTGSYYSGIFVTRKMPTEILELVRWLPTSRYRNDAVLFTKLGWQPTYFPLFAPDMAERYLIVSIWSNDGFTRRFIEHARPTLLITQRKDGDDRARIFRILGQSPIPALPKPVYTTGNVEVYDISSMTAGHHSRLSWPSLRTGSVSDASVDSRPVTFGIGHLWSKCGPGLHRPTP